MPETFLHIKSIGNATLVTFLDFAYFRSYLQTKKTVWKQGDAIFLELVLPNRAPSSTQLHQPPSSSFQPPPSSLQHPQQYLNQNIARNWAISQNLELNIKNCPFWPKIGTHGILEVLIPNPGLDFWNSNSKIHFWANLGPKIKNCPFCLKIGAPSISRILILNLDLDFWNFDPKIHFWANLGTQTQSCPFCLKIATHGISRMLILIPTLVSWISNPNFLFGQIWAKKVKFVHFAWKLAHLVSWGCGFLFQD